MTVHKDCNTFYDNLCKSISSQLLSHKSIDNTMTECDKTSCTMTVKSWFSTKQVTVHNKNSQNNYLQLITSSHADCMVSDSILTKARRIRIYPTQQQKQLFKQ